MDFEFSSQHDACVRPSPALSRRTSRRWSPQAEETEVFPRALFRKWGRPRTAWCALSGSRRRLRL